jgi:hypothetical protein
MFRAMVKRRPTHGASEWRLELINGSSATAYPADLLNQGLRLESLSLHGATIDEATAFKQPQVLWDVMFNRVTMPPPPLAAKLGITNTVRVLGAAKFTFLEIYKKREGRGGFLQMVIQRMREWREREDLNAPLDYVFLSANMEEHLPPDHICWVCGGVCENIGMKPTGKEYVRCQKCGRERIAWQRFFKGTLRRMRDAKYLMSPRLYAMRWMGKWQDTTEDVYTSKAVDQMRRYDCFLEERRPKGDNKSIYALGIDVGKGATERASVSALVLVKRTPPDPHYRIVYASKHRCSLTALSGIVCGLYELFGISLIMIDPGGGGVWLIDNDHLGATKQTVQTKAGKVEKEAMPMIMMDASMDQTGARILQLFVPSCFLLEKTIGKMQSADQMINWAHDHVSSLIASAAVISPASASDTEGKPNARRETILGDIDEALDGLLDIGLVQGPDGTPDLTKNGYFQYYPKPDLSYALVYGVAGMYLFSHERRDDDSDEDAPIVAISNSLDSLGRYREEEPAAEQPARDDAMAFLSSVAEPTPSRSPR